MSPKSHQAHGALTVVSKEGTLYASNSFQVGASGTGPFLSMQFTSPLVWMCTLHVPDV